MKCEGCGHEYGGDDRHGCPNCEGGEVPTMEGSVKRLVKLVREVAEYAPVEISKALVEAAEEVEGWMEVDDPSANGWVDGSLRERAAVGDPEYHLLYKNDDLHRRVRELADGLDAAVAWIDENTTVEQHEAWKRSANCGAAEKARKA